MESDFPGPVNIGSEEMIAINDLAKMTINISGKDLTIKNIEGPEGVRGRNSDNNLYKEKLNWEPTQSLQDGMKKTYKWIDSEVKQKPTKRDKYLDSGYSSSATTDYADRFFS